MGAMPMTRALSAMFGVLSPNAAEISYTGNPLQLFRSKFYAWIMPFSEGAKADLSFAHCGELRSAGIH